MVSPILDRSTAPPAADRRENDLEMASSVLDGSTAPAAGRPRDRWWENSPRAAAQVTCWRGAVAARASPTAADAPAAVSALAIPAPEQLPAPERPEIKTSCAAAREMTAPREEMTALREALTAHTSAWTQVITDLRGEVGGAHCPHFPRIQLPARPPPPLRGPGPARRFFHGPQPAQAAQPRRGPDLARLRCLHRGGRGLRVHVQATCLCRGARRSHQVPLIRLRGPIGRSACTCAWTANRAGSGPWGCS